MEGNMGNFKGVMLCNRPAQIRGSYQAGTMGGNSGMIDKPAFISTVKAADQVGLNPIAKEMPPAAPKSKLEDVTWRHKRWLAEFQERQTELVDLMDAKKVEVEEKKARFAEKAALQRAQIRACKSNDLGDDALKMALTGTLDEGMLPPVEDAKKMTKKAKKQLKAKPKWALTADQADDVEDLEVDDLVDFATNLDFEAFIDDMEVREAMKFVQERVQNLEGEEGEVALGEDGLPLAPEEGITEGMEDMTLAERVAAHKAMMAKHKKTKGVDDDGVSIAESNVSAASHMSTESKILVEGGLKGVHSAASVRMLMKQAGQQQGLTSISEQKNHNLAIQPPREATTAERGTIKGVDPSNLPYLFRHPAI